MPRIEPPQSPSPLPSRLDMTYEEVRQSFLIRLLAEQARLEALVVALGLAGLNPAPAFAELEKFAHRLRGAAAVFELPELRDDAKELEMIASDAANRRAACDDPLIHEAMRALASRLAYLNSGPLVAVSAPSAN